MPVQLCSQNEKAYKECCKYDVRSNSFNKCCEKHKCCPMCDTNGKLISSMFYSY